MKNFTRFNTPSELAQFLADNPNFSAEVLKMRTGQNPIDWQHWEWYSATSLPYDYAWDQTTRECTFAYESAEDVYGFLNQIHEEGWTAADHALKAAADACDFTVNVLVTHDGNRPEEYPRESISRSYDNVTYELVAA